MHGGILSDVRQIGFAVEATAGTAETHPGNGSVHNLQVKNVRRRTPFQQFQRDFQDGKFSKLKPLIGMLPVELTFETELYRHNAAGTADQWGTLMRACAAKVTTVGGTSNTYTLSSDRDVHVTLTMWVTVGGSTTSDGHRLTIKGCAGSWELVCNLGEPPMLRWTFNGVFHAVDDEVIYAPTALESTAPSPFLGVALTFDSRAILFRNLSINIGNRVVPRHSANAAAGILQYQVTNRDPRMRIDPELELVAAYDWLTEFKNSSENAIAFTATPNVAISIPKAAILTLEDTDRDDIATIDLELQLDANSAMGDDELSIVKT